METILFVARDDAATALAETYARMCRCSSERCVVGHLPCPFGNTACRDITAKDWNNIIIPSAEFEARWKESENETRTSGE